MYLNDLRYQKCRDGAHGHRPCLSIEPLLSSPPKGHLRGAHRHIQQGLRETTRDAFEALQGRSNSMLLYHGPLEKCMEQSMQAGRLMRKVVSRAPAFQLGAPLSAFPNTMHTVWGQQARFIYSFITRLPIRKSGALQQTFYGSPPNCPVLEFPPPIE